MELNTVQTLVAENAWLNDKLLTAGAAQFFVVFNGIGKQVENIPLSNTQAQALKKEYPAADVDFLKWNAQDLTRFAWVIKMSTLVSAEEFFQKIEQQFFAATPSEQASLLKMLVLLPQPERFVSLARFGTRSNVADVFLALAHHNPYPERFFDETGWNQLILKALFNGFELASIKGLYERNNAALAESLMQYAKERTAANRPVSHELWPLIHAFEATNR